MTCKICKWANHPPCPKNIPCCDCNEECNSRQCVEEEPQPMTKVCRTCGRELPLTEYYPQPGGVMGCKAECKRCYIERQQRKKYGQSHQVKHRPPGHQKTTVRSSWNASVSTCASTMPPTGRRCRRPHAVVLNADGQTPLHPI